VPSVRILTVEDYEPYRRFVSSALQRDPELQIVWEATDGPEAVQKAEELKPDLILLDVGLPTLNGLEAARLICKVCPASKIIFLSQESSAQVVEEAFNLGAWGYVEKSHAGHELLDAVKAVLRGKSFVSSGLWGSHVPDQAHARS
jgi:DNA-binding NarL/FixJ family response regulator